VTESGFTFGGHTVGSGNVHLSGSMADAYLSQGTTDDLTGRWEDVLTGIFGSTTTASEPPGIVTRFGARSRHLAETRCVQTSGLRSR